MSGTAKRKYLSSENFVVAEEVFKTAQFLMTPEDQTQKMTFRALLPYVYTMRNNGSSWDELAKLLRSCGIDLSKSSLRAYYAEMVAECESELKQQLKAHTLLLKEIRKINEKSEIESIAKNVSKAMNGRSLDLYN
jgi:hypothetical protein